MDSKIILGDCLELMKEIPNNSIDFILADLPFGTTKALWDKQLDLEKLWIQYKRIIKNNGAIVLFAQIPFNIILAVYNIEWLRYEWIWEKTQATGHLNSKKMPMKAHENLLVFYKELPIYNPQKTDGHILKIATSYHKRNCKTGELYGKCDNFKDYASTERFPRSIIKFKSDKQKENLFSTQKPIALCEYIIKTYTNENDIVLDNVAGSFTTAIACINTNRRYICMEIEEKIFNIGYDRIKRHLNRKLC